MDRLYRILHQGSPRHVIERDGVWRLLEGSPFDRPALGEEVASSEDALLAPVDPSKIVAVGLNYRDHAAEQNKPLPAEPMIFIKPSTAVIAPAAPILLPPGVGRVDHEAEVGVVIGRPAHNVRETEAHAYILGLTCANDVTARDLQSRDVQYTRCKGFDTFAPIGPCVTLGAPGTAIGVVGWVNGVRRQASNTRELIFPIPRLVAFISSIMTLLPGDVISTGTPAGIGPLAPGDRVTIRVESVGDLVNPVDAVAPER